VASAAEAQIEVVRYAIDAFNRRDVDALLKLADDDFVYDWTRSLGLLPGIYRGPEGFLEFVRDQWSTFDDFQVEAHDIIPRGRHVVATVTVHGRGRHGVTVSAKSTHLYTFEDGRLVRITLYQERAEALAAASE
jgi:ketosteroid isomerase-like protein